MQPLQFRHWNTGNSCKTSSPQSRKERKDSFSHRPLVSES